MITGVPLGVVLGALGGSSPAFAAPGNPRGDATAAEEAGRYGDALHAYRACAEAAPDRDRRACEARIEVLGPQEADGFAGWTVLSEVRRDRDVLGTQESRRRIRAALDANPSGPAAADLARWLAHQQLEAGEPVEPGAVAPEDRAWVAERMAFEAQNARHRWIGLAGIAAAGVYGLTAAVRPGPLAWTGALWAGAVIGCIPAVVAAAWDAELFLGFVRSGLAVTVCTLLAPRAPAVVRVAGTLGALAGVAWWNGWLASLGIP